MVVDANIIHLERVLDSIVNTSDNELIKSSSATLESQFLAKPDCLYQLTQVLSTSQQKSIRQFAALELGKAVRKHWTEAAVNVKHEIKLILPNLILQEPEKAPRKALCHTVGSIALLEFPSKTWNELMTFVFQCASNSNVTHREIGILLLYNLFEPIADNFPSELGSVFDVFRNTLVDPESQEVRTTSIEALSKFAEFVESDNADQIQAFQAIIPNVVNVFQASLKNGDIEGAISTISLFDTALQNEAPLLNKSFKELFEFMMTTALDKTIPEEIRISVVNLITYSVYFRKSRVAKAGLFEAYIHLAVNIATEDEDEDVDEDCPARAAASLLSLITEKFPAQKVYEILGPLIFEYIRSPNPGHRKSALVCLGVSCDGCGDFLSARVSEVLPLICSCLNDNSPFVRRSACFALSSLCDTLGQEITMYHETILPQLFPLANDNNKEVVKYVWSCIDSFMSEIGDDAVKYLPALVEKSGAYLDTADSKQKMVVIAAIGSAANASGEAFVQYFPTFIERLKPFLINESTDQDDMTLKAVSLDAIGNVSLAVGKDHFRPYVSDLMNIAFSSMSIKGSYIRDSAFGFFAIISSLIGNEFTPYLDPIMAQVRLTLDQKEFDFGDDLSEDLDSDAEEDYKYRNDVADEKETAINILSDLFENLREVFLPYLEPLTKELIENLDHFSDQVRKASYETLISFVSTMSRMYKLSDYKVGLPVIVPIDSNLDAIIKLVMPAVLQKWKEETEMEAVSGILRELDIAIETVGPALVADYLDAICSNILEIYKNDAVCQIVDDDEDVPQVGDHLAEKDANLLASASDVVGSLAKIIGPGFVNHFRTLFPMLIKRFDPKLSETDKTSVVAVMGDVTVGLEGNITEFANELLHIYLTGMADESVLVRSNAAFGIGLLCQHVTVDITSQYRSILDRLSVLFNPQEKKSNVIDNACGAVCRMIIRAPQACPVDQIIPVIISQLPLKEDFLENDPIYRCLSFLIQHQHSSVQPHLNHLQSLIHSMINQTPDHVSPEVLEILKTLS